MDDTNLSVNATKHGYCITIYPLEEYMWWLYIVIAYLLCIGAYNHRH